MNEKQLKAIQYLSLPASQRPTIEEIAAECGVSRSTIYDWKKSPAFIEELKAQIVRNNIDTLPELVAALPRIAMEDRSAAMAKLALQVNGMLTERVDVQGNGGSQTTDIEALKARIQALKDRRNEA
ncbi:phBC6A51 family helix-turn-helix protein [Paenibacillus sp. AR247]|uniref:phBC6A51 family helix-turn-helix protein n=1 Tax=Paenibacillus sp. AR247 TaxID=1631599 RepID=UPI000CF845F7|nr:phBC6A51 family helix-turn-helix protein [Paenibacillus sp. AR247]PQP86187.1 hypothetical protein CPT76_31315 [Paenibacillus sp. AR247]